MGVSIREKKTKGGQISLYLDIYYRGRREYEFLDLQLTGNRDSDKEKRRLAEIVKAQREVELFSGSHGLIAEHTGRVQLYEYAREKAAGKSKKSPLVKSLPLIEAYFGVMQLRAVNDKAIEGYQAFLKNKKVRSQKVLKPGEAVPSEKNLMDSTVANYFNALNTVLNMAVREHMILRNPAVGVKRVRPQESEQYYLTRTQLETLARTPIMGEAGLGGEIKRAFLFSCCTGLRLSDVKALTWGSIREEKVAKRIVKTKNQLTVDLNKTAKALIDYGNPGTSDERVFALTETDPNQYLRQWGAAAGIDRPLHYHISRHTFATLALDRGADLFTVQNLLGHQNVKMTQRYARATDRNKKSAVQRMEIRLD